MKKLITVFAVVGLLVASVAQADENYVLGGFEASGHIVTGTGWQTIGKFPGASAVPSNRNFNFPGVLGAYNNVTGAAATRAKRDHDFLFFVDEIELDLTKTFGENIRFRTDLDFGAASLNSNKFAATPVLIEQAYVTANIPVGNGVEVLVGRFNTPMGFESVDTSDRDTISASQILSAGWRPVNTTGVKFYYPFSDMFDLHLYAVTDLTNDSNIVNDNPWPSMGLRFGLTWGDEGVESTVGLSGALGNENTTATAGKKLTYLGDLDFNVYVTDEFAVGGEVFYRIDGGATGVTSGRYLAGLLNLNYDFSDVWDGTLKYAFSNDVKGVGLVSTFNAKIHEISLATGYSIADGATVKLEGNFLLGDSDIAGATGSFNGYGAAAAFSYDF